jgi:serine phosphatase RsbU (regulator of sigma subunit)
MVRMTGLVGGRSPRLGYAFTTPGSTPGYTVYAESSVPANRRLRIASTSAFAELDYALYIGRAELPQDLLATSQSHLPMTGRHASTIVPFGNSALTLVMAPRQALGGALSQPLPWIIAVGGTALSLGLGVLMERLVRRRQQAESLAVRLDRTAEDNRRLYAEQRTVAETLQRALLPDVLPTLGGMDTGVFYLPGVEGMQIGGDWYDIIATDETHVLLVVGDVSGRGIRAAAVMASLLFAVRAYAAQNDPPEAILSKLSDLLSVERTGHFATVLCIRIDCAGHEITVANAGHLPPLLLHGDGGQFIETQIGVPVGVSRLPSYVSVTVPIPPKATLIAFTDGLVERRGENLDVGLERLRDSAVLADRSTLDRLLSTVGDVLVGGGADDDTVMLGIRWRN